MIIHYIMINDNKHNKLNEQNKSLDMNNNGNNNNNNDNYRQRMF